MKIILTRENNEIYGPFSTIRETTDSYICDDTIYYKNVFGICTQSEVEDDYLSPQQKTTYNENMKKFRAEHYKLYTDVISFKVIRGEETLETLNAAINNIKNQFPYKEVD
jgi:hypothetical protein